MPTHINAIGIRRQLDRDIWSPPAPYGPDGWYFEHRDGSTLIVSYAESDGVAWIHASRTGPGRIPTYEEMIELHRAVWGDHGYSYQIQAPRDQHVNIHPYALHLWGRADGKPVLPEFGKFGSI